MSGDLYLAFICGAAVIGVFILLFNRLVTLARRSEEALADIDVQLKHRHDLIPSLVETVKGFAAHERGFIETVMQARNAAMNARTPEAQVHAEAALSSRLGQLLAVVENTPTMQASPHFFELRREIADVENKIAAARRNFNMSTSEYNAALGQFPSNLIGQLSGMRPRRFYDLGMERVFVEEAPTVKF